MLRPTNCCRVFQAAVRRPLPWIEVDAAPVHEVVHRDVDLLRQLPIPKHNEHDSGPYITAALLIARNPKTGVQNVSIHRCQVSGPDRIGVLLLPRHTLHYFKMAEQAGAALEIALVIGVHPACILASQAIAALDEDEMHIAGALLGRPVEMVKCRTNQIRVPAHAEIVIEGRILPKVREPGRSVWRVSAILWPARRPRGDPGRCHHAPARCDLSHHRGWGNRTSGAG